VVGQQAHILSEHAENELVDEMRDQLGIMPPFAKTLRDAGKLARRLLGKLLPRLLRFELLGVDERCFQPVANGSVGQIFKCELVCLLDTVGPVGPDNDPIHVGHDQQRRIFKRDRILQELSVGLLEIGVSAFILPTETFAPPHVGPAIAATRLVRSLLERERGAGGIGRHRIGHAQQRAEIIEMALRCRALLQLDLAPLFEKFVRCHAAHKNEVKGQRSAGSPLL
jgi:hypothetical protein